FSQAGFDILLSDQTLIIRAVPLWLRHSLISQWLPDWLQQLPATAPDNLLCSMLTMLLNANSINATAVLTLAHEVLAAPQYWVSAPLQLESTLRLLPGHS
ncbi:MAG: DNA mismatch repair protein MutL, partial [Rheinheimera sp.]|nr:DNA mismatch repair protein MutL [Rheinheimera sp.]